MSKEERMTNVQDSPTFNELGELIVFSKSYAAESDSPAERAGRGLSTWNGVASSQGIFFTCHARWQGSSRTMPFAHADECGHSGFIIRHSLDIRH
jgi:hypothetical protein